MTHRYIGTKEVTAWFAEKDGKPGYGVKYADGYTSWSPKATFEEAYIPIGNIGHMPLHQQDQRKQSRLFLVFLPPSPTS